MGENEGIGFFLELYPPKNQVTKVRVREENWADYF
jgi:hypothetical protein